MTMGRLAFSTSCLRRHATGGLTVKSLDRFESDVPIVLQRLPPPPPSSSAAEMPQGGTYKTFRRSAYAVLRNRNTSPGVCAKNLLSPKEFLSTPNRNRCCCAALLYRVTEQEPENSSSAVSRSEEDRERDDFVFALKLADVEQPLRELVGEAKYEALVGPALAQAQQVGLCECLRQLEEAEGVGKREGFWVARLLLTPEEDNRVKWLREDGELSSAAFARFLRFGRCTSRTTPVKNIDLNFDNLRVSRHAWWRTVWIGACVTPLPSILLRFIAGSSDRIFVMF
ncbi:hypothetical protein C4B63_10g433 [Trypanosoma cruzi]|uniref:Uncharacterized protein n=1 Tax=Trypanosoma cruzi TaxID=5693 RepID=A0A2V2VRF4_TRYCR|nr:hypothetical protein C4B63_10g433 [Trypanosoma cruzi]